MEVDEEEVLGVGPGDEAVEPIENHLATDEQTNTDSTETSADAGTAEASSEQKSQPDTSMSDKANTTENTDVEGKNETTEDDAKKTPESNGSKSGEEKAIDAGTNIASTSGAPNSKGTYGGFEGLSPEIQRIFVDGLVPHDLTHKAVDPVVFDKLSQFPLPAQEELATRFVHERLEGVKNKSGYLIGMMKKYRERERRSPGGTMSSVPIPKLPPPKRSGASEPNPDGGIKLLDPELKEILVKGLEKFDLSVDAIDPSVFESMVTFPMATQKEMIRLLANENWPKINNVSGYIVGMLVKFRKRFLGLYAKGGKRSRSRSPPRRSRGRSPPYSRGRSPPNYRGRSPDRRRSPYSGRRGSPYRDRGRSPYGSRRSPSRYDYYRRSPSPRYRSPPRSAYSSSSSASYRRSPPRSPRRSPRRSPPRRSPPRRASPPPQRFAPQFIIPQQQQPAHLPVAHPPLLGNPSYIDPRSFRDTLAQPAMSLPSIIPASLRQSWYFADRNKGLKTGPFAAEDIKREWSRGVMNPSWLAWHSEMENWQEIRTLPALLSYLTAGGPMLNGGNMR